MAATIESSSSRTYFFKDRQLATTGSAHSWTATYGTFNEGCTKLQKLRIETGTQGAPTPSPTFLGLGAQVGTYHCI